MDTSKTYILMAEKAEEIQKHRRGEITPQYTELRLQKGDYGLSEVSKGVEIHDGSYDTGDLFSVWLPRQDQLQEMTGYNRVELILRFTVFCYGHKGLLIDPILRPEVLQFTSMEQLWLAFVMLTLYQKHWSGTDWVKEG